jgi:hypothetical protein
MQIHSGTCNLTISPRRLKLPQVITPPSGARCSWWSVPSEERRLLLREGVSGPSLLREGVSGPSLLREGVSGPSLLREGVSAPRPCLSACSCARV